MNKKPPPSEHIFSAAKQRTALVGNADVIKMIGMQSVSGLNKLRVRDKTFPIPIKTSAARGARCRFDPAEVEQWIADKKAARQQLRGAES